MCGNVEDNDGSCIDVNIYIFMNLTIKLTNCTADTGWRPCNEMQSDITSVVAEVEEDEAVERGIVDMMCVCLKSTMGGGGEMEEKQI